VLLVNVIRLPIFAVHDEKLFSAMCEWSKHYLHRVIVLALLGVALLFACCIIHCKQSLFILMLNTSVVINVMILIALHV